MIFKAFWVCVPQTKVVSALEGLNVVCFIFLLVRWNYHGRHFLSMTAPFLHFYKSVLKPMWYLLCLTLYSIHYLFIYLYLYNFLSWLWEDDGNTIYNWNRVAAYLLDTDFYSFNFSVPLWSGFFLLFLYPPFLSILFFHPFGPMLANLTHGYSSESTQRELSNKYQHDRV